MYQNYGFNEESAKVLLRVYQLFHTCIGVVQINILEDFFVSVIFMYFLHFYIKPSKLPLE